MPKWLRKSIFVLVTVLTFGMVTPSQVLLHDHADNEKSPKKDIYEASYPDNKEAIASPVSVQAESPLIGTDYFVDKMVKVAEDQSFEKFGAKIKPVIENEFSEVILPNIEKAIQEVSIQFPQETLSLLKVSETPTGGTSEKIFHISNEQTNEDVIRFHVRRDHPPQQGYWFNFHYHTYHDQFQTHHDLGSIYWDKNTPPKWMS